MKKKKKEIDEHDSTLKFYLNMLIVGCRSSDFRTDHILKH